MIIQSSDIQHKTHHAFRQEERISIERFDSFLNFQEPRTSEDDETENSLEAVKLNSISDVFRLNETSDNFQRSINDIISQLRNNLQEREEERPQSSLLRSRTFNISKEYYEEESYSFLSTGIIKTDSGDFDINTEFSLSRSFMMQENLSLTQTFDPLIINVEGNIPELQESTFNFDLNNDSKLDTIALPSMNSGFLTLDKNSDGIVNDGNELFGTKTGNGFEELAQYDTDNNNWIDEADAIFDELKIWFKHSEDEERFSTLKDEGIGAIYLNAQAGTFNYKTAENRSLGELKSSSLFLKEDGTVGNVVQIDLALQNKEKIQENSPLETLLQA